MYLLIHQGTVAPCGKGSRTFACPLCCTIKAGTNPKQHIVLCCKALGLSEEKRVAIAKQISLNRFVLMDSQINEIENLVPLSDRCRLKALLLLLGVPMSKNPA